MDPATLPLPVHVQPAKSPDRVEGARRLSSSLCLPPGVTGIEKPAHSVAVCTLRFPLPTFPLHQRPLVHADFRDRLFLCDPQRHPLPHQPPAQCLRLRQFVGIWITNGVSSAASCPTAAYSPGSLGIVSAKPAPAIATARAMPAASFVFILFQV